MDEKLNRERAIEAIVRVAEEFEKRLNDFAVTLRTNDLLESYGAWLLPADLQASTAVRKSYELHHLLEQIEDRLKDLTNETFTVDLLTQARS